MLQIAVGLASNWDTARRTLLAASREGTLARISGAAEIFPLGAKPATPDA
jgi:hypothetical protein